MNVREVAWRVFAEEYNSSVLEFTGEGEKPVSYIVTPLGAKVNRMLVIGVATDIEDIGAEGKQRFRARVSDPSGTFYVSAGEYQPAAAASLSKISPPAFVAVVGKSRAYSPEEGVKYLSIRPERIREVDEAARDYWVIEAAKSTLHRINAISDGLEMERPSVPELVKLGYHENLADGVVRAIEYYKDIDLDRFRNMVRDAVRSLMPATAQKTHAKPAASAPKESPPEDKRAGEEEMQEVGVGSDEEDTVLKIIDTVSAGGRGAQWEKIVEAAQAKKIDKVRLEEIIASLLDKGDIYEPELGMMKRI